MTKLDSYSLFQMPNSYEDVNQIVNKIYLSSLKNYEIAPCEDKELDIAESACFFSISRIVLDKSEDILQKLSNVYSSAWSVNANVVMIIRGYASDEVEISLGVCGEQSRINGAYPKIRVLYDSFIGNFPGCRDDKTVILNAEDTRVLLNKCYDSNFNSVASVSCIASLRDERHNQNVGFYQGLDKVIETMNEKNYSIVIIARPVQTPEFEMIRHELEDLYSRLSGYAKIQLGLNWSVAEAFAQALSTSVTDGLNTSTSVGLNVGTNTTEGNFQNSYWGLHGGVDFVGGSFGGSSGKSNATTTTIGNTFSKIIAENTAKMNGKITTESDTTTRGRSVQFTVENKTIIETLARIDEQLKRLKKGESTGMFATAAYFFSPTIIQTRVAASAYKAVISGNDTDLENSAINIWFDKNYQEILRYLKKFRHPRFNLYPQIEKENILLTTTPAVLTTSLELAISMGLPRNKINGIPVFESVSFERNIVRMTSSDYPNDLRLGNVWHLNREEKTPALLNTNDLTMHCFITGTTGSGKSTAIYNILDNLRRKGIPFMVIEPVKGEYKNLFGQFEDVHVFGTNGEYLPVLRIDPFSFPKGIHILEHLDGLTEIFNVCWPLYAAMPAILKDGLERAYKAAGWNLNTSVNSYNVRIFPTLSDVMHQIRIALDESEYSDENKGNYVGSLCTRLKSLTNGLGGTIFSSNAIAENILFDESVILDLSRIRSGETKALIMGLLILKLQEYRQATVTEPNQKLCHVTVLEEAHNLMRTESVQQSGEASNMVQKSVEMLANAIAEVRTYGEGFIIADQAPEQLDSSVIRNTNTKIVFRLPKAGDREITGNAMNLNTKQIHELAKLPTGVAAVYQNDWQGTILVKLPLGRQQKIFLKPDTFAENLSHLQTLRDAIVSNKLATWIQNFGGLLGSDEEGMKAFLKLNCSAALKCAVLDYARHNVKDRRQYLKTLAYAYFNADEVLTKTKHHRTVAGWRAAMREMLEPSVKDLSERELDFLLSLLIWVRHQRDAEYSSLYCLFSKYLQTHSPLGAIM